MSRRGPFILNKAIFMNPRTLNLINIILVLFIFPVSALLVKDLIAYRFASRGVEVQKPVVRAPERSRGIMDYAPVTESPVFPSPAEKLVPMSGADTIAAPVRAAGRSEVLSGLKLIGTYVGPRSYAIFIKTEGAVQGTFAPGEEVFGQGVLKEVARDSAVIEVSGARVTLRIPVEDAPASGLPPLKPEGLRAPSGSGRAAQVGRVGSNVSRKTGAHEWVVSQDAVLNALEDMGQVLSAARLTPVREGARVTGFLITEIRPRGIIDAIGLKNGDILRRVNGYEITSPERAVQVLAALKGETAIDLDIVRSGQKLSFHYDIR